MSKADKLFDRMRSNPKGDWKPEHVRTLVTHFGLTIRQRGTSHAVITNTQGQHLTVPMHRPIKPIYIKHLIKLIEAQACSSTTTQST